MELLTRLRLHASQYEHLPSVSCGKKSLSYRHLLDAVNQRAPFIAEHARGEPVFVVANRSVELVCTLCACLVAGVPIAIVDPRQGLARIDKILAYASSPCVLVDNLGERLLANCQRRRRVFHIDAIERRGRGFFSAPPHVQPTAIVLFTSGSTGAPKGVRICRRDLELRLAAEAEWFEMRPRESTLGVLPLSFDVGLTQVLATVWVGGHHVMLSSWLAKDIIGGIQSHKPSVLAMSPMVWKGLLNASQPELMWSALNSLRYVTLSGGTLDTSSLHTITRHLERAVLVKTYGQTEMFRIASIKLGAQQNRVTSVGRAYKHVKLEIKKPNGDACAIGEEGEVYAGGMGKMLGYFGDADHAESLIGTGDIAYLDVDGFLHIKGRKDTMIKVLDQRVYPDDVAASMSDVLQIQNIVVVPCNIGDDFAGQNGSDTIVLVAFVGREYFIASEQELRRQLMKQLASHLVPARILPLDNMPQTASGKVDLARLREIAARHLCS